MIYFIRDEGNGNIKIGFTESDVEVRAATLQVGNSSHLRVLKTMPGTMEDEKYLQMRFASSNVCGEWFKPTAELMDLIVSQERKECGGAEVIEKSVQIKVLRVGRKQFTWAFLDQLSHSEIVCWGDVWSEIEDILARGDNPKMVKLDVKNFMHGDFWGWISVPSAGHRGELLIFEQDGKLYRSSELLYGPLKQVPDGVGRAFKEAIEGFFQQLRLKLIVEGDQIFMGV